MVFQCDPWILLGGMSHHKPLPQNKCHTHSWPQQKICVMQRAMMDFSHPFPINTWTLGWFGIHLKKFCVSVVQSINYPKLMAIPAQFIKEMPFVWFWYNEWEDFMIGHFSYFWPDPVSWICHFKSQTRPNNFILSPKPSFIWYAI